MTKSELMKLVGKEVRVYFKPSVITSNFVAEGKLVYVDEFSEKYDYKMPNMFCIDHRGFKVSHVRKVEVL